MGKLQNLQVMKDWAEWIKNPVARKKRQELLGAKTDKREKKDNK